MIDAAKLREILHYDPATGGFAWRVSRGRASAGSSAGCASTSGYVTIGLQGKVFKAHRLAWLYMTGEWPTGETDHKNCIRTDNRWSNLRAATRSQNRANSRPINRAGIKGVQQTPQGRWHALIRLGGKTRHLGTFDSPEEAHAAYVAAAKELHGEFARAA